MSCTFTSSVSFCCFYVATREFIPQGALEQSFLVAVLKAQPQPGAGYRGDEVLAILGLGTVGGTDDSKSARKLVTF